MFSIRSRFLFIVRTTADKRYSSTSSSSPIFVTSTDSIAEGKRPRAVVLVLGFGGAKPKHLAKYSQLYNSKGCTTVSGTASNYDIFVDHNGVDVFAKKAVQHVANTLRENDATHPPCPSDKETPIVMHIISNGGAFVAKSIGIMLNRRGNNQQTESADLDLFADRLQLGCQVFDSAPCYIDMRSSFNVIKHLIPNPFIGIPAAMLYAILSKTIPSAVSMITREPTRHLLFWNDLLADTNCNRQAFLYTQKDDIANATKIEEFIEERERRGVQVMVKHFEDSMHVQHLRFHQEEYSAFIDEVLTDMEGSNKER